MTRTTSLLLVLCTLAALSAPQQAKAAESYDNCIGFIDAVPATISSQGVWCLRHDVSTAIISGTAITIDANNVTIDCNGFKIGGLGAGINTSANGIQGSKLNTVVRHCNIRGFNTGALLLGTSIVEDNQFELNTFRAVYVGGDGSIVRRNTINDTGGKPGSTAIYGIYTSGTVVTEDNVVTNLVGATGANASLYGILTSGGDGAVVSRNAVRGFVSNGTANVFGIYASNGTHVFITGNRVSVTSTTPGIGIRCNSANGSIQDNVVWGFSEALGSGCLDDGGNAGH